MCGSGAWGETGAEQLRAHREDEQPTSDLLQNKQAGGKPSDGKTRKGRREEEEENKGVPRGSCYLEGVNGLLKRQALYRYAIDI